MARPGPKPQYAKREALEKLLLRGVSMSEAARRVGVDRCRRRSKREPVTTVEKGAMRSRWRDDQRGCVGRDSVSAC